MTREDFLKKKQYIFYIDSSKARIKAMASKSYDMMNDAVGRLERRALSSIFYLYYEVIAVERCSD